MSNTKAEKYSPKWLYDKIAASNNEAKGIFYILEYQRELEKSLTIPDVVVPKGTLVCDCKEPLQFYEHDKHCTICNLPFKTN